MCTNLGEFIQIPRVPPRFQFIIYTREVDTAGLIIKSGAHPRSGESQY